MSKHFLENSSSSCQPLTQGNMEETFSLFYHLAFLPQEDNLCPGGRLVPYKSSPVCESLQAVLSHPLSKNTDCLKSAGTAWMVCAPIPSIKPFKVWLTLLWSQESGLGERARVLDMTCVLTFICCVTQGHSLSLSELWSPLWPREKEALPYLLPSHSEYGEELPTNTQFGCSLSKRPSLNIFLTSMENPTNTESPVS